MSANSETAVKDGMEDILSDTERATLEEAYKSKEEIPVKDSNGEVIGVWSWNEGFVASDLQNAAREECGQEFTDKVNLYIHEEWSKKLAEFQKTEEYQKLNEEERIVAEYNFKRKEGPAYYLGGSLDGAFCVDNTVANAFRNTETYKNLNKAERLIAECDLQLKCRYPDYSKETDMKAHMERCGKDSEYYSATVFRGGTFIDLSNSLSAGEFNPEEAAVAANWLRENYDASYDWGAVEQNAKESLVFEGKTVAENAPNAIPVWGEMTGEIITYVDGNDLDKDFSDAVRGKQMLVDVDATRDVIKAIDNDATLSAEEKNQRKVAEARGYCDRVDEVYAPGQSEKNKSYIKDNVLRYHPDLAAQLEREGTSGKMHDDRTSADNVGKIVEMNPEQGAKLVSNRVQEGAENAGVDTSISANEPKMNENVEGRQQSNQQSDQKGSQLNPVMLARMNGRPDR